MGPAQWGSCSKRINFSELLPCFALRRKDRMDEGWEGKSYGEMRASALSEISCKHTFGRIEEKHFPVAQHLTMGIKAA